MLIEDILYINILQVLYMLNGLYPTVVLHVFVWPLNYSKANVFLKKFIVSFCLPLYFSRDTQGHHNCNTSHWNVAES